MIKKQPINLFKIDARITRYNRSFHFSNKVFTSLVGSTMQHEACNKIFFLVNLFYHPACSDFEKNGIVNFEVSAPSDNFP